MEIRVTSEMGGRSPSLAIPFGAEASQTPPPKSWVPLATRPLLPSFLARIYQVLLATLLRSALGRAQD